MEVVGRLFKHVRRSKKILTVLGRITNLASAISNKTFGLEMIIYTDSLLKSKNLVWSSRLLKIMMWHLFCISPFKFPMKMMGIDYTYLSTSPALLVSESAVRLLCRITS